MQVLIKTRNGYCSRHQWRCSRGVRLKTDIILDLMYLFTCCIYHVVLITDDGSFSSVAARNSEVLGLNPSRVGCLSLSYFADSIFHMLCLSC